LYRSPYARKVRIVLAERDIPFKLQTEVPWNSTTETPKHNPLEKLPVLIDDSTSPPTSVYESSFVLEWLEANYGPKQGYKAIYPAEKADELLAKQIQVVADGMCDACVLMFVRRTLFSRLRQS
jgi:glutathione S-transferase